MCNDVVDFYSSWANIYDVWLSPQVKIFLTASAEIRAKRRYDELSARGVTVDYEKLLNEIRARDDADAKRAIAPLRQAEDANLVDSSDMSIEEVVGAIVEKARGSVHA